MSKGRIWSKLSTPSTAFFKAAPGGSPTRRNKEYRPSASYVVAQVLPCRLLQLKLLTAPALYSSQLLTAPALDSNRRTITKKQAYFMPPKPRAIRITLSAPLSDWRYRAIRIARSLSVENEPKPKFQHRA